MSKNRFIPMIMLCLMCVLFIDIRAADSLRCKDFKIHNTNIDNPNQFQISFLINDATLADSVHLMFGTGKDQNDLFHAQYPFSCSNGACYITVNGQQHQITRYKAAFQLTLSDDVRSQATYATLYVFKEGEKTHTLYYRLK